jgi:hypothetical protein
MLSSTSSRIHFGSPNQSSNLFGRATTSGTADHHAARMLLNAAAIRCGAFGGGVGRATRPLLNGVTLGAYLFRHKEPPLCLVNSWREKMVGWDLYHRILTVFRVLV